MFLDIKQEDKIFWTEWQQTFPEFNLLIIYPWTNLPHDLLQDNASKRNEGIHSHHHWNCKPLCVTSVY
jgi:hypothetical protein